MPAPLQERLLEPYEMKDRASIFETDDIDVSRFKPKAAPGSPVPIDQVRTISEASRFPSRAAKRPPRIHRTGRTLQFNCRATPETVEAFYSIADQHGWLVSETLENALAALQRELKGDRE
jgi:hypothetical protein